jgi:hypothetical protein
LSQAELEAKFRDCAGRVLPMEQVERSLVLIGDLEKIQIKELAEALRG